MVHLVRHQPELLKYQSLGNLAHALRAPFGGMPDERVQPLAGPWHEQRRPILDPPLNVARTLFLTVNDHGLLGGDLQHLLARDFLMDAGVEPNFRRSGKMFLPSVTETDNEIISRMCDMMDHPLELAPPVPHTL